MEKMITGYQYGDDFRFAGPYKFPDNKDQEAVHLPPATTLKEPPKNLAPGMAAFFDEATDSWVVRVFDDPIAKLQAEHAAAMKKADDERLAALQAEAERLQAQRLEEQRLAELEQAATEAQTPATEDSNVSAS